MEIHNTAPQTNVLSSFSVHDRISFLDVFFRAVANRWLPESLLRCSATASSPSCFIRYGTNVSRTQSPMNQRRCCPAVQRKHRWTYEEQLLITLEVGWKNCNDYYREVKSSVLCVCMFVLSARELQLQTSRAVYWRTMVHVGPAQSSESSSN